MKRTALILALIWTAPSPLGAAPCNPLRAGDSARSYTITAYCPCAKCCGVRAGRATASGKLPRVGVTVAGPRALPFGTRVRIPGVGDRLVQDRLARRFDDRFDVFFATHDEARRFGRRELQIQILK